MLILDPTCVHIPVLCETGLKELWQKSFKITEVRINSAQADLWTDWAWERERKEVAFWSRWEKGWDMEAQDTKEMIVVS